MTKCSVCRHPRLSEIQQCVIDRSVTVKDVCIQFGITAMALSRHNRHAAFAMTRRQIQKSNSNIVTEVVGMVKEYQVELLENPGKRLMMWHAIDSFVVDYIWTKFNNAGEELKQTLWRDLMYCVKTATNNLQQTMRLKLESEANEKVENSFNLEVTFIENNKVSQDTDE